MEKRNDDEFGIKDDIDVIIKGKCIFCKKEEATYIVPDYDSVNWWIGDLPICLECLNKNNFDGIKIEEYMNEYNGEDKPRFKVSKHYFIKPFE